MKVVLSPGKPHFDGGILVVHTTERPEKGMANRDIIQQVAKFYGVRTDEVKIRKGLKSRRKLLEVPDAYQTTELKK